MTDAQEARAESMRDALDTYELDDAANGRLATYLLAHCSDVGLLRRVLNDEPVPECVVTVSKDGPWARLRRMVAA